MFQRSFESITMRDDEEQKETMLGSGNGDGKWKEKMMEGEEGLWTMECLRGRLLAERVASRTAKEDAEFMGNKLIELEKQLKLETELRNKAQKKLKFLMKKMESLNLSPVQGHSSSVKNTNWSSTSSTSPSSLNVLKEQKLDSPMGDSLKYNTEGEMNCPLSLKDLGNEKTKILGHQIPSIGWGSNSVDTSHSCNNSNDLSTEEPSKDLIVDDIRQASTSEKEFIGENNPMEYTDNLLALVPANVWSASQTREPPINNDNVCDVLAALRHAREKLHNTMGRRNVISSHSVGLCGV